MKGATLTKAQKHFLWVMVPSSDTYDLKGFEFMGQRRTQTRIAGERTCERPKEEVAMDPSGSSWWWSNQPSVRRGLKMRLALEQDCM